MSEGKKKKKYPCHNENCNEIFNNRTARYRHMKQCLFAPKSASKPTAKPTKSLFSFDEGSNSYICKKCSVVIKHRNNLSRHPLICTGVSKKKTFNCPTCIKEFQYQSKLEEHMKVHNSLNMFTCMYCCKIIKGESNSNRHIISCARLPSSSTKNSDDISLSMEYQHTAYEENEIHEHNLSLHFSDRLDSEIEDISFTSIHCENASLLASENSNSEDRSLTSVQTWDDSLGTSTSVVNDEFIHHNDSIDIEELHIVTPVATPKTRIDTPIATSQQAPLTPVGTRQRNTATPVATPQTTKESLAPRRKQFRDSKTVNRKSLIVDSILEKVEDEQRERILKKSMGEEMMRFADATMAYFRDLIREARRSHSAKAQAAHLLVRVFGNDIWDDNYQEWLVRTLKFQDRNELISVICYEGEDEDTRGRKMLPVSLRQDIYDFWKANSEVSTYRSNDRHIAKINKSNILPQHQDIVDDDDISDVEKNSKKSQCHRKFVSMPYRVLHKIFQDNHVTCSFASFYRMKPFYISPVTVKEMETCLCIVCCNYHCLYNAVKRNVKQELPYSLSDYLCGTITCPKDNKIDFHEIKCVKSICENACKPRCVADDLKNEIAEANKLSNTIPYYQFESVTTYYNNKHGKKVSYDRTTRVDKHATLEEIVKTLDDGVSSYLQHRFLYKNDSYYWKNFLNNSSFSVLWIDYSQNLAFKEMKQAQSANYSGVQQTLHNTLLQMPHGGPRKYIYHLSDDTNHDSVLTFHILEDIIKKHPEVIINKRLVIRSDNCTSQYKSKKVFKKMWDLAIKYDIEICWFYGVPGHGKGTVDAMSSFGIKKPLSQQILADKWFHNAGEMVDFLKMNFTEDDTKEHNLIDSDATAKERRKKQKEFVLEGCRSFRLISVNPGGKFTTLTLFKDEEYVLNLDFSDSSTIQLDKDMFIEPEDEYVSDEILNKDTVFELVEPGSFIGLRTPCNNPLEIFFVAEVIGKYEATENFFDEAGHQITAGEKYLLVNYLNLKEEWGKNHVKYARSRNPTDVCIHLAEVFATNLELDENLCMKTPEYRSLVAEAL